MVAIALWALCVTMVAVAIARSRPARQPFTVDPLLPNWPLQLTVTTPSLRSVA